MSPLAFSLFLLAPAVALFCLQWNQARSGSERDPARSSLSLKPRLQFAAQGAWSVGFLQGETGARPTILRNGPAAFPSGNVLGHEMLMVGGDPFLVALTSGVAEGTLVIKGRDRGVPVLGPPVPANRNGAILDRNLMRAIRTGVGGSFQDFLSNLYGKPDGGSLGPEGTLEENPFQLEREAAAESNSPNTADETASDSQADTPKADKNEPAKPERRVEALPSPAAGAGAEPRTLMLMWIGEDGQLHHLTVDRLGDETFGSDELGAKDFNFLAFNEPMEFPTAATVADFNGDGNADIGFVVSQQGYFRIFLANEDGTYTEGSRVEVGRGPRSLVAGDFNRDGRTDVAISSVGTGLVTVLFSDPASYFRYRTLWLDTYRDYVNAADTRQAGALDLVGMDFSEHANVLLDFSLPDGMPSTRVFDYSPSLETQLTAQGGRTVRLNAVMLGNTLSLNLDNRAGQMVNTVNLAGGANACLILGDLDRDGSIRVAVAKPKH